MKYAVIFLLVCVAMATAAPQFFTTYNGLAAPGVFPAAAPATVVAGPSVYNGYGYGGRFIAPGYINTFY